MFLPISLVFYLGLLVNAYVPALPTNSTQDAIAGGLNVTDISNLNLQWYSNGSYSEHVSYQLAGSGSTGISKGVLVHFSEEMANNITPPTNTPWIALVSCDRNASTASMDEDIFTLARDKGAVSALLYSLYSLACVINPQYSDPQSFDQVFDIFSTKSLTSAHLIEYQFGQLSPPNESRFAYDSQQLNDSASDIFHSLNMNYPTSQGYLLAVLQAYNATDSNGNNSTPTDATQSMTAGTSGPNTALAMIVLYAITGCVSALFCIVIISGAIRAIRHPERYGPRARMGDNGVPQGRARGLTRAILDTFPIVKFGTQPTASANKDPERQTPASGLELENVKPMDESILPEPPVIIPATAGPHDGSYDGPNATATYPTDTGPKSGNIESSKTPESSSLGNNNLLPDGRSHDVGEGPSCDISSKAADRGRGGDVVPASIGREICPICIVDFEEGDDIRLLPCEGKHSFHQQCVDPWLLKLSSSCPLCRHDFLALENMLSGHSDAEEADESPRARMSRGRFSQYLRFATRRQMRREENDPTDPYMPMAPETSLYSGM
ncbi:hypothetical protein BYT27DRAFT_7202824 [Phlegmacium glaucopus]|nr:hypothetical protein BYT27DRAFT_7202824 [Phlegmacium glaucopus]